MQDHRSGSRLTSAPISQLPQFRLQVQRDVLVCVCFPDLTVVSAPTQDGLGRHPTWQRSGARGGGRPPLGGAPLAPPQTGALSTDQPVPEQGPQWAPQPWLPPPSPAGPRKPASRGGAHGGPGGASTSPVALGAPTGRPSRTGSAPAAPVSAPSSCSPSLSLSLRAPSCCSPLCEVQAFTLPSRSPHGAVT